MHLAERHTCWNDQYVFARLQNFLGSRRQGPGPGGDAERRVLPGRPRPRHGLRRTLEGASGQPLRARPAQSLPGRLGGQASLVCCLLMLILMNNYTRWMVMDKRKHHMNSPGSDILMWLSCWHWFCLTPVRWLSLASRTRSSWDGDLPGGGSRTTISTLYSPTTFKAKKYVGVYRNILRVIQEL